MFVAVHFRLGLGRSYSVPVSRRVLISASRRPIHHLFLLLSMWRLFAHSRRALPVVCSPQRYRNCVGELSSPLGSLKTARQMSADETPPLNRLNGVAHVFFTVRDVPKSAPFYHAILSFLGLKCVANESGPDQPRSSYIVYYVGGRTAVGIREAGPEERASGDRFVQSRVGLHHVCLRASSRSDVDAVYRHLRETVIPAHGGRIVHGPEDGVWAPGYYSVLFEDPDGIRLEVNYVPGKGLLADAVPTLQGKL